MISVSASWLYHPKGEATSLCSLSLQWCFLIRGAFGCLLSPEKGEAEPVSTRLRLKRRRKEKRKCNLCGKEGRRFARPFPLLLCGGSRVDGFPQEKRKKKRNTQKRAGVSGRPPYSGPGVCPLTAQQHDDSTEATSAQCRKLTSFGRILTTEGRGTPGALRTVDTAGKLW